VGSSNSSQNSNNGSKNARRPWSGEARRACHSDRLFDDRLFSSRWSALAACAPTAL